MKVAISAADRTKLVNLYRQASIDIANSIATTTFSGRARLNEMLRRVNRILKQLDEKAAKQAREMVESVYRGNIKWTDGWAKKQAGMQFSGSMSAPIHRQAIEDLVLNPESGLVARMKKLTGKMRSNVKAYASSLKTFRSQLGKVNFEIGRGVIQGLSAKQTRARILSVMKNNTSPKFLGLDRLMENGAGAPIQHLIDSMYLKVPLKNGGFRRMHVYDHANMLAFTQDSIVRNRARNNRLIQNDIKLVQISPHPPLTPDVCAIYAGRIYALDDESAAETGYPLIHRLPNGGPPFHPYCFTGDTIVATSSGNIAIYMVEPGMQALTAQGNWRRVVNVFAREYDGNMVQIELADGTRLIGTPEHRIVALEHDRASVNAIAEMIEDWQGGGRWLGEIQSKIADDVAISAVVTRAENECPATGQLDFVPIASAEEFHFSGKVYTLEVEHDHTYTANGIAVFNCTHSTFPFIPEFQAKGDLDMTEATLVKKVPTVRGTPKAALDVDFARAQKWMKERGGLEFAVRQNPQLALEVPAKVADPAVQETLSAAKSEVDEAIQVMQQINSAQSAVTSVAAKLEAVSKQVDAKIEAAKAKKKATQDKIKEAGKKEIDDALAKKEAAEEKLAKVQRSEKTKLQISAQGLEDRDADWINHDLGTALARKTKRKAFSRDEHEAWLASLSQDEALALRRFTHKYDWVIRKADSQAYRLGKTNIVSSDFLSDTPHIDVDDALKNIRNALARAPEEDPEMVLYRGIHGLEAEEVARFMNGGMIENEALMSLSESERVAARFTVFGNGAAGKHSILFQINKGRSTAKIQELSVYDHEFEHVAPSGTRYRIVGVEPVRAGDVGIVLDVVGKPDGPKTVTRIILEEIF